MLTNNALVHSQMTFVYYTLISSILCTQNGLYFLTSVLPIFEEFSKIGNTVPEKHLNSSQNVEKLEVVLDSLRILSKCPLKDENCRSYQRIPCLMPASLLFT